MDDHTQYIFNSFLYFFCMNECDYNILICNSFSSIKWILTKRECACISKTILWCDIVKETKTEWQKKPTKKERKPKEQKTKTKRTNDGWLDNWNADFQLRFGLNNVFQCIHQLCLNRPIYTKKSCSIFFFKWFLFVFVWCSHYLK